MKQYIKVRNQFEGIHCWKDCPHDQVSFLRNPHRHIFYVYTTVEVNHSRAVEFFMLQNDVTDAIAQLYADNSFDLGERSCEMMAKELYEVLSTFGSTPGKTDYKSIQSIEVSEDGENSAIVKFCD